MILLGKAFHYCCEGLNLSLQGRGARFVTLIVMVIAIEQVSTMQLFVWEVVSMAYLLIVFPTDDAN